MIVTFCGHGYYNACAEDERKISEILDRCVGDTPVEFFLGGYGDFDSFAWSCARKYKEKHGQAKLVYITPYLLTDKRNDPFEYKKDRFDLVLYPGLENVPPKFAISRRNRWMVEQADLVIAYITHTYGGSYATYTHAKRKKKLLYNIAREE